MKNTKPAGKVKLAPLGRYVSPVKDKPREAAWAAFRKDGKPYDHQKTPKTSNAATAWFEDHIKRYGIKVVRLA